MRVDLDHGCGRMHHSFPALAACTWPNAGYILGDGAHALVAHCDIQAVTLYPDADQAARHRDQLDTQGCGRRCTGDHEVVHLTSALSGTRTAPHRV